MKPRVVFMGSPEFAVPTLEALNEAFNLVGVITQPDKPTGRGRKLMPNPVKNQAIKRDISFIQPDNLSDDLVRTKIIEWAPDVIVVVAYGKILPQWLLEFPEMGCVNAHASILPRHRGASPISTAIAQGDKTTGVTTMMMDNGLDTGDVLLQAYVEIDKHETTDSLSAKLMELGADLVVQTILKLMEKSITRATQDSLKATSTRLLKKSDGKIDWNRSAIEIDRLIRAMNPWPIAFFDLRGESIKVWESEAVSGEGLSGQVIDVNKSGLTVGTRTGLIVLKQLQAPGKKRVAAFELASSKGIKPGDHLNIQYLKVEKEI